MVVTWIVQMNDERESSAYLKSSNSLIAVPGMTGIGASYPLPRVAATGPLSDHRAGSQPLEQERVFMPQSGPFPTPDRTVDWVVPRSRAY